MKSRMLVTLLAIASATSAYAGTDNVMATKRDNATNFKDRALSFCVSKAYAGTPAEQDAGKTGAAYLGFTYYDLKADPAVDALIDKYLKRDYSTPMEGFVGVKFSMLKCMDLYHSRELADLVKKYVPHPNWIGDKPAK